MKNNKTIDYRKEKLRGEIKQIMKVRGLRTISLSNYQKYVNSDYDTNGVHSLKLNLQDGYLNLYSFNPKTDKRSGAIISSPTNDMYESAYKGVMEIVENEVNIPTKYKRNILVKMTR